MKTMKDLAGIKILSYSAIILFLFFTSCKDNDKIDFDANDNANLQSESNSDAQLEESLTPQVEIAEPEVTNEPAAGDDAKGDSEKADKK